MKQLIAITALMLLPQLALARVYMCVDPATGRTSFTDHACDTSSATQEEIALSPINPGSGNKKNSRKRQKSWRSQVDNRKTGTDFNSERRALYENKATASNN